MISVTARTGFGRASRRSRPWRAAIRDCPCLLYTSSDGIFATEGEGTDHALSLVRHGPLGGVNLSRIDAVKMCIRDSFGSRQETVDKALAKLKAENPDWDVMGLAPDLTDYAAVEAAIDVYKRQQ